MDDEKGEKHIKQKIKDEINLKKITDRGKAWERFPG